MHDLSTPRVPWLLAVVCCGCSLLGDYDHQAEVMSDQIASHAVAYFRSVAHDEQPEHRCASDGRAEGETGITPPLDIECADGCTFGSSYDAALFEEHPVWQQLDYTPGREVPHKYHFNYKWKNTGAGYGKCLLTIDVHRDGDEKPAFTWDLEITETVRATNPYEPDIKPIYVTEWVDAL